MLLSFHSNPNSALARFSFILVVIAHRCNLNDSTWQLSSKSPRILRFRITRFQISQAPPLLRTQFPVETGSNSSTTRHWSKWWVMELLWYYFRSFYFFSKVQLFVIPHLGSVRVVWARLWLCCVQSHRAGRNRSSFARSTRVRYRPLSIRKISETCCVFAL